MRFSKKIGIVILQAVFLSTSFAAVTAGNPPSPTLQVTVDNHKFQLTGGFDSIISVNLPSQQGTSPYDNYQTSQFFILQTLSYSDVEPNGVVDGPFTLASCAITSLNWRNAHVDCSASLFAWRVNPQVYPGTSTGTYYVGFGLSGPSGVWAFTYTVTGLYNGQTITLTKSFNVNLDPPASNGPVQYS